MTARSDDHIVLADNPVTALFTELIVNLNFPVAKVNVTVQIEQDVPSKRSRVPLVQGAADPISGQAKRIIARNSSENV